MDNPNQQPQHLSSSTDDLPDASFMIPDDDDDDDRTRNGSSAAAQKSQQSSVLANKFNSLDERWTDHKAKSPIKIVRARRIRRRDRIALSDDGTSDKAELPLEQAPHRPQPSPGLAQNLKRTAQQFHPPQSPTLSSSSQKERSTPRDNDASSVSESTVSTLSSTGSVFERLHRQGIQTPRLSAARIHGRANISRETQSLTSPINPSHHYHHTPRIRNRLEAYETRSLTGVVDSGKKTPRRRGTKSTRQQQYLTSDHSLTNDEDSVYERLYRNEKRSEKLWSPPPTFTPELPRHRSRLGKAVRPDSASSTGDSTVQDDLLDVEERQSYSPFPFNPVLPDGFHAAETTLEEDLEAIRELGKQLGGTSLGDCSPTVAATSISTNNDTLAPLVELLHYDEDFESRNLDYDLAAMIDSADNRPLLLSSAGDRDQSMPEAYSRASDKLPKVSSFPSTAHFSSRDLRYRSNATERKSAPNSFFTLDSSFGRSFLAERIVRLSSPANRRTWRRKVDADWGGQKEIFVEDNQSLLTPRLLRHSCAVTIQTAWRRHSVEVRCAGDMIQTWKTGIQRTKSGSIKKKNISYNLRVRALTKAMKNVRSWWILEGVLVDGNTAIVVWEDEIVDRKENFCVSFECEALLIPCVATRWKPRKMAILLVKAGLKRAIRGEKATFKLQQWYRHYRGHLTTAAAKIQTWTKQRMETIRLMPSLTRQQHGLPLVAGSPGSRGDQQVLHKPFEVKEIDSADGGSCSTQHDAAPLELALTSEGISLSEHQAAIIIQSWLRISVLRTAAREWPSSLNQLQSALKTAECGSTEGKPTFDQFDIARTVLYSSAVGQRLCESHLAHPTSDSIVDGYVGKRAAAMAIHNIVRVYVAGLKKFRNKQRAIRLQSVFRGYMARKKLGSLHLAAVIIQFRWTNHRYMMAKTRNAVLIQRFWRMTYCERNFSMLQFCVVYIQANWRCFSVRRCFSAHRLAALSIQRVWRGHRAHKAFLKLSSSLLTLQRRYRQTMVTLAYLEDCQMASQIQALWRINRARRLLRLGIISAIKIQSWFRGQMDAKRYDDFRRRIVVVQCAWKMILMKNQEVAEKAQLSAILVQSTWRGSLLRCEYNTTRHACIVIQKFRKGLLVRRRMQMACSSMSLLKAIYRTRRTQREYGTKLASVRLIQSHMRRAISQRKVHGTLLAAATIQRIWRGKIGRLTANRLVWTKAIQSAILIQRSWRAASARDAFNQVRVATILLQSSFRWMLARQLVERAQAERHNSAALKIQMLARDRCRRLRVLQAAAAATEIQSLFRGNFVRHSLLKYSNEATAMQSQRLSKAAIIVQSSWRSHRSQHLFLERRIAAVVIQSCFRGYRESICYNSRIRLSRTTLAAVVIQSYVRMFGEASHFQLLRRAIIKVQIKFRSIYLRRQTRSRQNAVTMISAHWRGFMERRQFSNLRHPTYATNAIQTGTVRCGVQLNRHRTTSEAKQKENTLWSKKLPTNPSQRVVRDPGIDIASSAIVVQRSYRAFKSRRESTLGIMYAAIKIQRVWRAATARAHRLLAQNSILLLQSHARRFMVRKEIASIDNPADIHQSSYQKNPSRSNLRRQVAAATIVQSTWRDTSSESILRSQSRAAIEIQNWYKKSSQQSRLSQEVKSSTLIQTCWRRSRAEELYVRHRVAAIAIQAVVRGAHMREIWWFLRFLVERRSIFFYSASKIQTSYAIWKSELAVWEMKSLAVLLQRGLRGQLERSVVRYALFHVNSSVQGATITKSLFRLAEKRERGALAVSRWHRAVAHVTAAAAVVLQSFVRGYLVRKELQRLYGLVFPPIFRAVDASSVSDDVAYAIQIVWRKRAQRRNRASVDIQKYARVWLSRRTQNKQLVIRRAVSFKSAMIIQSYFRRFIAQLRFRLQRSSVLSIQRLWRRFNNDVSFVRMSEAAAVMQDWSRGLEKRESAHHASVDSAIIIQRLWRLVALRQRWRERKERAKLISNEVTSTIRSTISSKCASRVERLLRENEEAPGPCLGRLVSRVNAVIVESMATATAEMLYGTTQQVVPVPSGRSLDPSVDEA